VARTVCKILGFGFLAIGIIGFFEHQLLGMHLSNFHNLVHLVSGGFAVGFGTQNSERKAQKFCRIFGSFYFALGILGFIAPDAIGKFLMAGTRMNEGINMTPDNIVHIVLGGAFVVGSYLKRPLRMHPPHPAAS
jgi:hypothetical protein